MFERKWMGAAALCALSACMVQGPKGDPGVAGNQGVPGTFIGVFDGGVTFTGDVSLGAQRTVITFFPSDGGEPTSISNNGLYCGSSPAQNGQFDAGTGATGYRAAKVLCEQACGSPTAHMCSAGEIIQTLQVGMFNPQPPGTFLGWYSSGSATLFSASPVVSDCIGWGDPSSGAAGSAIAYGAIRLPNANYDTCDQVHPILCCR